MFNKNKQITVTFTQSARRHKIGRTRVRQVLEDPVAVINVESPDSSSSRLLVIGEDRTGRPLEVIAVFEGDDLVVIHAMDLRAKYRHFYEKGTRE